LLPELTAPTERLCFNVIYRGPQKFAWTEIPLTVVKAIRRACGTSVNDVLLALITATIRRYSELGGDRVSGRLLRIMVPVNQRGNDSASELGNRISLIPSHSIGYSRPKNCWRLYTGERRSSNAHMPLNSSVWPVACSASSGPMQASPVAITSFQSHRSTWFARMCQTQIPLYLLGHKMLHWYPMSVGGELAVNAPSELQRVVCWFQRAYTVRYWR
jgi:hypothetical protein